MPRPKERLSELSPVMVRLTQEQRDAVDAKGRLVGATNRSDAIRRAIAAWEPPAPAPTAPAGITVLYDEGQP